MKLFQQYCISSCVYSRINDIAWVYLQSNRSGKTSRALSGAASTEDPTAIGADSTYPVSGNLPVGMANLGGSHEGSLKGKGTKATTRWSGLFGSTYKVNHGQLLFRRL